MTDWFLHDVVEADHVDNMPGFEADNLGYDCYAVFERDGELRLVPSSWVEIPDGGDAE